MIFFLTMFLLACGATSFLSLIMFLVNFSRGNRRLYDAWADLGTKAVVGLVLSLMILSLFEGAG